MILLKKGSLSEMCSLTMIRLPKSASILGKVTL